MLLESCSSWLLRSAEFECCVWQFIAHANCVYKTNSLHDLSEQTHSIAVVCQCVMFICAFGTLYP